MENQTNTAPPRNRRPFVWALFLFAAPLALAFAIYYGTNWRPTATTNKGELISPAIPLPTVQLTTAAQQPTEDDFLRKKWALVYVDAGACAEDCRRALSSTRDGRLLLGKDATRVTRVFFYTGACCDPEYFPSQQADLESVAIDNDAGQSLLAVFPTNHGAVITSPRIYIVDPLGNLMMSYAADVDPRDIYQDLKKLLNLSHIG